MRLAVALFVSATFVANPSFGQGYDTHSHCRQLAGGSYSLEQTCRNMERKAQESLQRTSVSHDVWLHCTDLMGSTASYSLLQTCVGMEERAKAALYGPTRTDQVYDARKEGAKPRSAENYHDPAAIQICPPPRKMTERDGCQ
jgi:hypothetical protein